ncbi:MAG: lipid IV(A) 3-deoxy-D-manno-octulosonic acid transferase [Arenimonas sp.]
MRLTFTDRLWLAGYSLLLVLLLPTTLYHLVWRGMRQREYLQRWDERFAFYPTGGGAGALWLHAVSVGEVNAAAPLVRALRAAHPDRPLLLTTVTPTGSARAQALFGDDVRQVYLPYDTPGAVRHFLDHFGPRLAVVLETELWPNLYVETARRGIPLLIVNARLSERSMRGYRWIRPLVRIALKAVTQVAAQARADLDRYVQLGLDPARGSVPGNLKYDQDVPAGLAEQGAQWRARWGGRPVWIAASTHPEEEAAVLAAHAGLLKRWPDALLLWAPRHPERFERVVEQAAAAGLRVGRRTREREPGADTQCFVVDTLGELMAFYAAADVAFVGGSLQPIGGHNLLEPAALGVPMVVGPHTFNFADITARLHDAGAVQYIDDASALGSAVAALLADPDTRRARGEAGRASLAGERGALARTLALVESALSATNGA